MGIIEGDVRHRSRAIDAATHVQRYILHGDNGRVAIG